MRKTLALSPVVLFILGALLLSGFVGTSTTSNPVIYQFNTMVGIPAAFTGTSMPIRGINGGGLPWMLTSANGELSADGHLVLNVRGLVLAAGANAGKNPIADFRAVVSCLTATGGVANVSSGLFPATTGPASSGGGNARVDTFLSLPQTCIAPLIFVTSPAGAWFATTGH